MSDPVQQVDPLSLDYTLPELTQMAVVRAFAASVARFDAARHGGQDSQVLLLRSVVALMDEILDAHTTEREETVIEELMQPIYAAYGRPDL